MESKIRAILDKITHPESGHTLLDGGYIESINATEERISITLRFEKSRDPFSSKLRRDVEREVSALYPASNVVVIVKEGVKRRKVEEDVASHSTTTQIAHIIAIASGKGGVGKSTVTANLAIALRDMGFRVGVLDADIYGPSQPRMFGCEGFLPEAIAEVGEDGVSRDYILPAQAQEIKVMSIGFFIKANDPLLWRGSMASNALKQLLHQTKWGALDFLLVDLPPGTGDIHLTILDSIKFSSAVIVSTPQAVALADVVRGVEMFAHEKVNVPLAGIIENMAYFCPDDAPTKRYYLFGRGGASRYAEERNLPLLGEIPIYESIMNGGDNGTPASGVDERVQKVYDAIAGEVIKQTLSV